MNPKFIRLSDLGSTPKRQGRIPAHPNTILRWEAAGTFPKAVWLGENLKAWRVEDIERWERLCAESSRTVA